MPRFPLAYIEGHEKLGIWCLRARTRVIAAKREDVERIRLILFLYKYHAVHINMKAVLSRNPETTNAIQRQVIDIQQARARIPKTPGTYNSDDLESSLSRLILIRLLMFLQLGSWVRSRSGTSFPFPLAASPPSLALSTTR